MRFTYAVTNGSSRNFRSGSTSPEYSLPKAISLSNEYQLPNPLWPTFRWPMRLMSSLSRRCLLVCGMSGETDGGASIICANARSEKIAQSVSKRRIFRVIPWCSTLQVGYPINAGLDQARDELATLPELHRWAQRCKVTVRNVSGKNRCLRICPQPASC